MKREQKIGCEGLDKLGRHVVAILLKGDLQGSPARPIASLQSDCQITRIKLRVLLALEAHWRKILLRTHSQQTSFIKFRYAKPQLYCSYEARLKHSPQMKNFCLY